MAELIEHEKDCLHYLGDKATKVHIFLDHMTRFYPPDKCMEYHRTFYHNSFGISLLKEAFGKFGEQAGLIHLVRDYFGHPIIPNSFDYIVRQSKKALLFFDDPHNADAQSWTNIIKYKRSWGYAATRKNEII